MNITLIHEIFLESDFHRMHVINSIAQQFISLMVANVKYRLEMTEKMQLINYFDI